MKILVLTFYFPPDLSAGSFRSASLVAAMQSLDLSNLKIDVVTTWPNRYSSFDSAINIEDFCPEVNIYRIKLPHHRSGMLDQAKAFFVYAKATLRLLESKDYDVVCATSSRLMTGVLGAYLSRKLKKPFYLDIRDIFVDTIRGVFPRVGWFALVPLLSILERYAILSADRINLVSPGFLPYFEKRYPNCEFELFTNGIDDNFVSSQPNECTESNSYIPTVLYAGNIGEGQGLHKIIPGLAKKFEGRLYFKIIGDGGRSRELKSALEVAGCGNVEVLPPIKRDDLLNLYQSADILFLHLNDIAAFEKVLPSKLFEYAATGKPIWAGVDGYASDFINLEIENSAVFSPCNLESAIVSFENLKLITFPRSGFVKKFSRSKIMKNMAKTVIKVGRNA